MTADTARVRQNYWAILVASLSCFFISAAWYTFFMNAWLSGTGRTVESITEASKAAGLSTWMPYVIAFVCAVLMATTISCVTQLTGPQTAGRGVKTGALLWLGIVVPVWATEYVFEVRPLSLFGINAGFWLIGMTVMGAIVGGWKKKA